MALVMDLPACRAVSNCFCPHIHPVDSGQLQQSGGTSRHRVRPPYSSWTLCCLPSWLRDECSSALFVSHHAQCCPPMNLCSHFASFTAHFPGWHRSPGTAGIPTRSALLQDSRARSRGSLPPLLWHGAAPAWTGPASPNRNSRGYAGWMDGWFRVTGEG